MFLICGELVLDFFVCCLLSDFKLAGFTVGQVLEGVGIRVRFVAFVARSG